MNSFNIIKRPLVTEKVVTAVNASNTVAFEVDTRANKIEIKKAVEEIWKVHVKDVRTLVIRGKTKRFGMKLGKRKNWKKAYVTLQQGDKIDLFTA
jgi:large subunit ribosomal protein L23